MVVVNVGRRYRSQRKRAARPKKLLKGKDHMVVHLRIAVLLIVALASFPVMGEEKPRIYLGASSKTLGYSPLWVASKKGFFDQQGLDVQVVLLRGVPMTVQALIGGSLHFGSGGPEPYIEAQSAAWIWWSPGGSSMVSPNLSSRPRITGRTKICAARPLVSLL